MIEKLEISDVAKETIDILNYFNPTFYSKISPNVLNRLKQLSSSSNITVKIDKNKKLIEQDISNETKNLISLIYYSYFTNEEQKKELKDIWNNNELLGNELDNKYDTNELFNNKSNKENNVQLVVVEHKKSTFSRILEKIKRLFGSIH